MSSALSSESERVRICDKLAEFIERGRTAPREIDCMRIGIWARDVIRYQRDVTHLTRSAMMGLWAWSRANPDSSFEDFLAASERAIAVSGGA